MKAKVGGLKVDLASMSLVAIIKHFRGKHVSFKLKDGSQRVIFVNEIESEADDQPELVFMADYPEDDVWISDILTATVVSGKK
ncbi:MAG: hypothetical protein LKF36_04970 [Lactobacillus sp.]|jgi:hypothetical protein|nr:hypothetical protein [Lactobacillus sp.]